MSPVLALASRLLSQSVLGPSCLPLGGASSASDGSLGGCRWPRPLPGALRSKEDGLTALISFENTQKLSLDYTPAGRSPERGRLPKEAQTLEDE